MPQFLVAIQHPDNFDSSRESEQTAKDIHALNEEMIVAGVRRVAVGLEPAGKAKTLRRRATGEVGITDGPFAEAKEHVGGFWIIDVSGMDEALAWAGKAVVACGVPVEVRGILFNPRDRSQSTQGGAQ